MTTLVGTGVYTLFSVWIIAFILYILSLHVQKAVGLVALTGAVILTVILLLLPKKDNDYVIPNQKEYDYSLLWRYLLVGFLGLCSIASIIAVITQHFIEPVSPIKIVDWVHN